MKKPLIILVIAASAAILISCGSSIETQKPAPEEASPSTLSARRDSSLSRFIDGSLKESKGDYAGAVIEYQEALSYMRDPAILFAISRAYSSLGKHSLAAQHAREAVEREPANLKFRENLAQIYLNAYQYPLALKEYESILALDSSNTQALFTVARLLQPTQPLKALSLYKQLLENEGDQWDILLQAAELSTTLGRFSDAATYFKRMLSIDPGNRALRRQLAGMYVRSNKDSLALEELGTLVETDSSDVESAAALGELYLERGKYDSALVLYNQLMTRLKGNAEVKLRIAIAYFGRLQRDSTLEKQTTTMFRELIAELPGDWRPHWYLGAIAATHGRDSVAIAHFDSVTARAEWNADAWYYLGSLHMQRNELTKAVTVLERAVQRVKADARLFLLLGVAYDQLQQHEKAADAFRRGLGIGPEDVNLLSSLALTYNRLNRMAESDSLYERALQIDPGFHLALNNYAYSLSERRLQLDRALEMSKKAVEAEPHNGSYLDTLGWVYFMLGKYDLAMEYVGKSIASGEASPVVLDHMGDIYQKLGDRTKAREYWQKALDKEPTNQSIKAKLDAGS